MRTWPQMALFPDRETTAHLALLVSLARPGDTELTHGDWSVVKRTELLTDRPQDGEVAIWYVRVVGVETGYYFAGGHEHPVEVTWASDFANPTGSTCLGRCAVCDREIHRGILV